MASNYTGKNNSSDDPNDMLQASTLLNLWVIFTSIITMSLQIVTVTVLRECKRVPFQLKQLSYNFIISDGLLHFSSIVTSVGLLTIGMAYHEQLFYIRTIICSICLLVSLAAIAGLTLERLVALCYTMQYSALVSMRNIRLCSLYIWLTHTVVPVVAALIQVFFTCSFDNLEVCHMWEALFYFRLVIAFFYIVYHSFIAVSYFKIHKVLKRHVAAISQHRIVTDVGQDYSQHLPQFKQKTAGETIIYVILMFEFITLPILLHSLVFVFVPSLHRYNWLKIFQSVSYCVSFCNTFFCLYLYVYKINECRMIFLRKFMSWIQKYKSRSEQMRLEIYHITPLEVRRESAF